MLVSLDAADRLVCLLEQRRSVPAEEAARLLLALTHAPTSLAAGILDELVRRDARLVRQGSDVLLAPSPLVDVPLERARFAVLDVETTGFSVAQAQLTELGIVVLDSGQVENELGLMIGGPLDLEQAVLELHRTASGAVLVGHNIRFDLAFVNRALAPAGLQIAAPTVDTLTLARRLLRGRAERASLAALAEFFGVATAPCHRALPDARATAEILLALVALATERGARTVSDLCGLARTAVRSARSGQRANVDGWPASRRVGSDRSSSLRSAHGE